MSIQLQVNNCSPDGAWRLSIGEGHFGHIGSASVIVWQSKNFYCKLYSMNFMKAHRSTHGTHGPISTQTEKPTKAHSVTSIYRLCITERTYGTLG